MRYSRLHHMLRFVLFAGMLLACASLLFAACAPMAETSAGPAATPADTAPASPTLETASPLPQPGEICALAEEAFHQALLLDFSGFSYDAELDTIPELMEATDTFTGMTAAYAAALDQAAAAAVSAVQTLLPDAALAQAELSPIDWRLMVALSNNCAEAPEAKLARLTQVRVTLGRDNAVYITATHPELACFMENETPQVRYGMVSIFAYLNTAYEESGEARDYDGSYELSAEYIAGLADPLPKRYIKNGWFNDRSNATRRHTGTDIRAKEGEDILSCTGGTVWAVDYGELAGNYVAVLDEHGFLYVYCHMVELTDFLHVGDTVSPGDVVGHVGNTGNSDADHLHLSIISPEYTYINPYPVLKAVRAR